VLVFQGIFGQAGVPWWLPPFLFVLLVALGADYNIFLMSRIREEARTATTADATARGLALTGHVITSAGIILAGTFAALLFAPMKGLQQMGFATTVGILLDTFVVRSLLVPSIATLLGRHNWWPSSRAYAP
jgi:RND superfamily putative drug exporter